MALMPESLEEGDKITAVINDRAFRTTVVGHTSSGYIMVLAYGRREPNQTGLTSYDKLSLNWIHGWHTDDSPEFKALLAAHKLARSR